MDWGRTGSVWYEVTPAYAQVSLRPAAASAYPVWESGAVVVCDENGVVVATVPENEGTVRIVLIRDAWAVDAQLLELLGLEGSGTAKEILIGNPSTWEIRMAFPSPPRFRVWVDAPGRARLVVLWFDASPLAVRDDVAEPTALSRDPAVERGTDRMLRRAAIGAPFDEQRDCGCLVHDFYLRNHVAPGDSFSVTVE